MIGFILGVIVGVCVMACIQINHDNDAIRYWKHEYLILLETFANYKRGVDSNADKRD